jgi:pimeloyl-ACP methyl ester carboxylesterase
MSLIAHSWGTLAAQQAAIYGTGIDKLVLFGPVVTRAGNRDETPLPAWDLVTEAMQRPRQRTGLPEGTPTPVSEAELDRWCAAYLASDPAARQYLPPAVKIPNGASADLNRLWADEVLVDSHLVKQPTMIVRGEWDHVTTDADAAALFRGLGSKDKRDVKISGGNHWLHLQPARIRLWAETTSFLQEGA